MLRQFSFRRTIGSFLLDWSGTLAVLYLSAYLRAFLFQFQWGTSEVAVALRNILEAGPLPEYLVSPQVFAMVSGIWIFFFVTLGVYDGRRSTTMREELLNVSYATVTATLVLAGLLFLTYRETSRGMFLIFFLLDLGYLVGWRVIWRVFLAPRERKRNSLKTVLVIGAGPVGAKVASEMHKYAERSLDIVGFVDDDPDKRDGAIEGVPVLGDLDQIPAVIEQYAITDAVIALPLRAHERMIEIARTLQDFKVRVHIIPDLFALSFPNAELDGFGGIPVIALGHPGLQGSQRLTKRMFDILVSTVALVVASPVMILSAIAIKLDSPGPVFYKQDRIGENGQPFTLYKFRSMKTNADTSLHKEYVTKLIRENIAPDQELENGGRTLKMEADPRITRVGALIRKTSIDELPQLINVLRGEMSLVGPRPPLPYEVEVYEEWHKHRLDAPPGITGLWQVTARNQVSFDEMVRLDIEYIEKYSLWLDIKLILQTPWALISTRGAG